MEAAIRRPNPIQPSPLLRLALYTDAVGSGAVGVLMLAGAGVLTGPLGLPAGLLQGVGLFVLLYAAGIAWLAARPALPAWVYGAVIGLNLVWAADSLLLLASGWVAPTALGVAFILGHTATGAGFGAAQWLGLNQSRA